MKITVYWDFVVISLYFQCILAENHSMLGNYW